jgi:hypothetical protein
MTFQWIHSRSGQIRGFALLFGKGHVEAGRAPAPWRICDACLTQEAIVFCTSCNVYVCEKHLARHIAPGWCNFLSVSAARDLMTAALQTQKKSAVPAKVIAWP